MGLVEGFGHVSARLDDGGFALTSTAPMATATAGQVLILDDTGQVREGDAASCPLEAPLHAATYAARPDVGAICRTHSKHAAGWAARRQAPPLLHGLGGLSGRVAVHQGSDLVTDQAAGRAAARDLGRGRLPAARRQRGALLRAGSAGCDGPGLLPGGAVRDRRPRAGRPRARSQQQSARAPLPGGGHARGRGSK
ncbi:MAG: class II aldolase/adducin family protein [Candidatus Binatia bacterium]